MFAKILENTWFLITKVVLLEISNSDSLEVNLVN